MPAQQQKLKGLPKRVSSAGLKARRARSWARSIERKKRRSAVQEARAKLNRERRAAGLLTPWEVAKARRLAKKRGEDYPTAAELRIK